MNGSIGAVIAVVLGVLCLGIGITVGCLRGLFRNILHLLHLVASAVLAIPVTFIVTALMGEASVKLAAGLLNLFNIDLSAESPNLAEASESLLSALVAGVVFILSFLVVFLILLVILRIFKNGLAKLSAAAHIRPAVTLITGVLFGAVCGLLVFAVVTMPVVGISHTLHDSAVTLSEYEQSPIDEEKLVPIVDVTEKMNQSLFCRLSWGAGQRFLYRTVVAADTENGKASLDDEMQVAVLIAGDVFTVANRGISWGQTQVDAVTHIASSLRDAKAVPAVLAGLLSDASSHWLRDETYFGVTPPAVKAPVSFVMDSAYLLFSTTKAETIEADLLAFADMISSLEETGVLELSSDPDKLMDVLNDGEAMKKLGEIGSDGRAEVLQEGLVNAAAEAIVKALALNEEGEPSRQTFDKLVGKITDALSEVKGMSEAERRKAVSDAIAQFGPEYGVTVDSEKAAAFAEKALAVLGEKDPAAITPWEYITALAGAASVLQD